MFFSNSFWLVPIITEVGMMVPGVGLVYVPTTTGFLTSGGLVYGA
jgi:hypothetical protein